MITPALQAEIRRLYFAEHWRIGTIATQLEVHHDVVRRVLDTDRFAHRGVVRPSALDPYRAFIGETLERYPRLQATRIHEMLRQRGYRGSVIQVRRLVRRLRPKPKTEAYLRLTTLPGEQGQVDWGHFGTITIGKARRPLSCFVLVLSWSRAIYAEFTLDQTLESFMRGHVNAFAALGGVPRILLYDNLKAVVLERLGDAVRFQPRLLELAGHYHFQPRPCAVARGNEKGRVERQIQYLRHSFFAARTFRDVDDLNRQFGQWRDAIAHQRPWPEDRAQTVAAALEAEHKYLLKLPEHAFETTLVRAVKVDKTPYVRFDKNRYSVPHRHAGGTLTLVASRDLVRILDGAVEVARHDRSYERDQVVERPEHIDALWEAKHAAKEHRGRGRLISAVPRAADILAELGRRGEPMAPHTKWLLRLLDEVGAERLANAVATALQRDTPSAASVAHLLDVDRRARRERPSAPVVLPDDPRVRDLRVTPPRLDAYDQLSKKDPAPHD